MENRQNEEPKAFEGNVRNSGGDAPVSQINAPAPQPVPQNAVPNGGYFCTRCGGRFNEFGVCPKCGNRRDIQAAGTAGLQMGQQGVRYPSQPGRAELMFRHAWDYVKLFFSKKPLATLDNVVRCKEHIWLVIGTAAVLLTSLCSFGIGLHEVEGTRTNFISCAAAFLAVLIAPDASGRKIDNLVDILDNGGLMLLSVLFVSVIQFFAAVLLVMVFCKLLSRELSFKSSANVVSISLLPLALSSAAGLLLSFINPVLGAAAGLVGAAMHLILLYYGLQKAIRFSGSPFWAFAGFIAADGIALFLIVLMFCGIFC